MNLKKLIRKLIRHHAMKGIVLAGSLLLLLLVSQPVHAQNYYEVWHTRDVTTTKNINSVTHGEGTFVAVGNAGTILTSPDGTTWTPQASDYSLLRVTYGEGIFVAVGLGGTILTSPDGTTWTLQTTGTAMYLNSVTWGEGAFVAVGQSGTILTSPDGTTWTPQTSGIDDSLQHVAYGNGTFVAGSFDGAILTSPNGTKWTERTSPVSTVFRGIIYGEGIFVIVGNEGKILTSPNGTKWTERTSGVDPTVRFFSVTHARGLFTAVADNGTISNSPDGITWTSHTVGESTELYKDLVYGNRTLVIVGDNGIILQSDAAPLCVYTPASFTMNFNSYKKGSKTVKVTATTTGESCDAPDLVPGAEWMNVEVTQWKNNKGTVKVTVDEYLLNHQPRNANLSIEGTDVTVNQTGPNCTINNMPASTYNASAGGVSDTFAFNIFPPLGCSLDVTTTSTFLHVGAIESGLVGKKTVNFTVDANDTTKTRSGKITVTVDNKKKQFSVKQAKP